jgi:caffeoyl-CoA O-methyltransferase
MEIVNALIESYCSAHSSAESELLQHINRDTHANVLMPRMLSGHLQGQFLSIISKLKQPKYILEIGTYTGYSALCLAEGLHPEGKLLTLDINEELESRVRGHFAQSEKGAQIDYRIGNALEIIPSLEPGFDLVFIDADKINYAQYYDLVIDKTSSGGLILLDNVLWSGKVCDESRKDKDTEAIRAVNQKVQNDPRVSNMLLPLRDGLMMVVKH